MTRTDHFVNNLVRENNAHGHYFEKLKTTDITLFGDIQCKEIVFKVLVAFRVLF